jgi:hypothetical protein
LKAGEKKNKVRNSLRRNPNWHKARLIVERTAISSAKKKKKKQIKPKILDRLPFKLGGASLQG